MSILKSEPKLKLGIHPQLMGVEYCVHIPIPYVHDALKYKYILTLGIMMSCSPARVHLDQDNMEQ